MYTSRTSEKAMASSLDCKRSMKCLSGACRRTCGARAAKVLKDACSPSSHVLTKERRVGSKHDALVEVGEGLQRRENIHVAVQRSWEKVSGGMPMMIFQANVVLPYDFLLLYDVLEV